MRAPEHHHRARVGEPQGPVGLPEGDRAPHGPSQRRRSGGPAPRRGAAAVGQGAQCCRCGAPGERRRDPRRVSVDAR